MSETEERNFFTPSQKRIVATGATVLAALFLIGALYGLFRVLQSFVSTFSDVLMPLAIAGVLALLLRPIVRLFQVKLKLGKVKSIVLLYALMIVVLSAGFSLALPVISKQVIDLIDYIPKFVSTTETFLNEKFPELIGSIQNTVGKEKFDGYMDELSGSLKSLISQSFSSLSKAGKKILSVFGTMAAYAVLPVYLFYLLDSKRNYGQDLEKELSFIKKEWRSDLVFLVEQFVDILVAFFRGQIVIGLILAVVLATGFSLVGLKFGLLLGGLIGILNIVPYLGTIIGITVVLPLAYFQPEGGWTLLGLCVFVFVAAQLFGDYVLTPRIMGKQTGMNPMLIIFSIFFWGTALGGILGMILAIPLTAFFLVFWRLLKQKYLPMLTNTGGASPA
ncbi:AI-2E family transporter [Rubellicoccus peritrichatus]|uniref:AI-2E family transporter n=1 Tax=Rubellicoccus peritrichatus TaxID=3080537 RepID=A0AAQ3LDK6_9BACT|nr:AI-2E family transporter [Puniceicoccus sp. CR14]WOO43422.1 AI-2E family transporter [Puniceicoccus sp. CR14]